MIPARCRHNSLLLGEGASFCRSAGMRPISLDTPQKEQHFLGRIIDKQIWIDRQVYIYIVSQTDKNIDIQMDILYKTSLFAPSLQRRTGEVRKIFYNHPKTIIKSTLNLQPSQSNKQRIRQIERWIDRQKTCIDRHLFQQH